MYSKCQRSCLYNWIKLLRQWGNIYFAEKFKVYTVKARHIRAHMCTQTCRNASRCVLLINDNVGHVLDIS